AARYVFPSIRPTRRTAAADSSPGGIVTHWRHCTCRAASGPWCSRPGCSVLRSYRSLRCGRWISGLEDRRRAIGESEARELRDLREQASRQPCGGQERAALGAQRAFGRRPIGGNGCVTTCAEHGRAWYRQYCLQVWGRGSPPAAGDRPPPGAATQLHACEYSPATVLGAPPRPEEKPFWRNELAGSVPAHADCTRRGAAAQDMQTLREPSLQPASTRFRWQLRRSTMP